MSVIENIKITLWAPLNDKINKSDYALRLSIASCHLDTFKYMRLIRIKQCFFPSIEIPPKKNSLNWL